MQIFLIAEVVHPRLRARRSPCCAACPGPVFFPLRALAVVYVDLFRERPDDPRHLHPRLRRAGAPAPGSPHRPALLGDRLARPRVLRVRRRGVPSGDRVGAPEPVGGRALARTHARPDAPLRRRPAGRPARDPAPPERLHRPDRRTPRSSACSASSRPSASRRSRSPRRSTTRPYIATALIFIALTVPMARFTDWLVARDKRRQQAARLA